MWQFFKNKRQKEGNPSKIITCSFCGKTRNSVRKIIAGPNVYICDECIDLCNDILGGEYPNHKNLVKKEPRKFSAGDISCAFCNMPAQNTECLIIPDRGSLCFVCLEIIRQVTNKI